MPLIDLTQLAPVVCVVAAVVMVATARDRLSRVTHGVMLAAMLVLATSMSAPLLWGCAGMLTVTAVAAALVRRRSGVPSCAADSLACAALVALMAGSVAGMSDPMSMNATSTMPVLLALGAVAVVLSWAVVGRERGTSAPWPGRAAGWLMMLAMGAMLV